MIRTVVVALVAGAVGAAPVAGGAGEGTKAKEAPPSAFTLGLVQKGLRPGLTQADVAERLGAPNILTRDAEGREAWVYDKVSSEVEASSGSVGVGGLGSGVGSSPGVFSGSGRGSGRTRPAPRRGR